MSFDPLDAGDEGAWAEGPEEDPAPLGRSRVVRWSLTLVAFVVVAAIVFSLLPTGGRRSRPATDVSGVVSGVSADGSSFCMVLDSTGKVFCSAVLPTVPTPELVPGQHVTGSMILVDGGSPVPYFVMAGPGRSP